MVLIPNIIRCLLKIFMGNNYLLLDDLLIIHFIATKLTYLIFKESKIMWMEKLKSQISHMEGKSPTIFSIIY